MTRPVVLVLVLVPVLAAACVSPDAEWRHEPAAGLERVLAVDLAPAAASRRQQRLALVPRALAAETQRLGGAERAAAAIAGAEVDRVAAARTTGTAVVQNELARRPHLPAGLVPGAFRAGQDVADGLVLVGGALVPPRRPLPEIDDVPHRTDPDDARPEATWWQRLRRRLRL
jgi:hypothetical protein